MKKKKILLIDGYNIIHAWGELKKIIADDDADFYIAREKLIEMMGNYSGYSYEDIIIVFDAHKVQSRIETHEKHGNIHVIYTRQFQTADEYIELFVGKNAREYSIEVATSDNLEQVIVMGRGGKKIDAQNLYMRVKDTSKNMSDKYINNDTSYLKNTNKLFENLDSETAKWLDDLRFKN